MKLKNLPTIDLDITTLKTYVELGYINKYWTIEPIKHRRRKIDNINYNTKKMRLIKYVHIDNGLKDFFEGFLYHDTNTDQILVRYFNPDGHHFEILSNHKLNDYLMANFDVYDEYLKLTNQYKPKNNNLEQILFG